MRLILFLTSSWWLTVCGYINCKGNRNQLRRSVIENRDSVKTEIKEIQEIVDESDRFKNFNATKLALAGIKVSVKVFAINPVQKPIILGFFAL